MPKPEYVLKQYLKGNKIYNPASGRGRGFPKREFYAEPVGDSTEQFYIGDRIRDMVVKREDLLIFACILINTYNQALAKAEVIE
jgi:hypothetical protein